MSLYCTGDRKTRASLSTLVTQLVPCIRGTKIFRPSLALAILEGRFVPHNRATKIFGGTCNRGYFGCSVGSQKPLYQNIQEALVKHGYFGDSVGSSQARYQNIQDPLLLRQSNIPHNRSTKILQRLV
jgi:hypothetical protein